MTTNSEKFLRVIDSSTTEENNHRTHEIVVNGTIIPITFVYGEQTILPFEQGIKFMRDGFTVEEVEGGSLNLPAVPSDNVAAQLKDDEVVAKFSELTTSSLLLRAAQKTGGEIYLDATEADRENVIAFIRGIAPVSEVSETETLIESTEGEDIIDLDIPAAETATEAENATAIEVSAEDLVSVTAIETVDSVETVADESQSEEIVQNEVATDSAAAE